MSSAKAGDIRCPRGDAGLKASAFIYRPSSCCSCYCTLLSSHGIVVDQQFLETCVLPYLCFQWSWFVTIVAANIQFAYLRRTRWMLGSAHEEKTTMVFALAANEHLGDVRTEGAIYSGNVHSGKNSGNLSRKKGSCQRRCRSTFLMDQCRDLT